MDWSTSELLFGRPYTERGGFGFGILLFVVGVTLLFWMKTAEMPQGALITGSMFVLGGLVMILGSICSRLNIKIFSEHWNFIVGIGLVIGGTGSLLFPLFKPTIFAIVVGLSTGLSIIGQGVSTARVNPQPE